MTKKTLKDHQANHFLGDQEIESFQQTGILKLPISGE